MINSSNLNPFLEVDDAGRPSYQLKLSLVFYLDYAPGPKRARRVFDLYMHRFGSRIRIFKSTSSLGPAADWSVNTEEEFHSTYLPSLQKYNDWGYVFSDGNLYDNHLFMFHGYRPFSEPEKASFFRFEWPWNWDTKAISEFAEQIADTIPFLSGTGGYIISVRPFDRFAYDRMYALCRRYWGIEAWNLDLTVDFVRQGYKSPSWLTLIGFRLLEQSRPLPRFGDAHAGYGVSKSHGLVLRSRAEPAFIDQNRGEPCVGEKEIALALLPLQITKHSDFGGRRWDGKTMDWLYRFYK